MTFVDITELVDNPLRTGIQRVVRKLLREWPGETLKPCRFNTATGTLDLVPQAICEILREEADELKQASVANLRNRIRQIQIASIAEPVRPPDGDLLLPELFFEPARCAYYLKRLRANPRSIHVLLYDFIPWLAPNSIGVEDASVLMHYLQVVQAARSVAFISSETRDVWVERIVRRSELDGPVIPLGADGLAMERQSWDSTRATFVCVGSLDGRRNQHLVVRAFQSLWKRGFRMRLVIFGHAFDQSSAVAREVIAASEEEDLLDYHSSATDNDIHEAMRQARATVYVSSVDGFGLPPVESLNIGVPVIVTDHIPSIRSLPALGQIRISATDPEVIASAVLQIADDQFAEQLWRDASSLSLPGWRDFGRGMHSWLTGSS
ncbi:MAG: glycosyltransferase [Verrucomicrobiaceae bacterium]|nr:MAG: glycosyltransferase [Verrucomicrobiaceae bacterium]